MCISPLGLQANEAAVDDACAGAASIQLALSMIRAGRTGAAPDVIIAGGGEERLSALPLFNRW